MKGFLSWLKNVDKNMYNVLSKHKPGSAGFNSAWKGIAAMNPGRFDQVQHAFIKATHFTPAATSIKNTIGFDVSKYPKAVQDVLWSVSVQHGPAGAQRIFKAAGIRSGMSAKDVINRVYNERSANNGAKYFPSSSASIRRSVVNRFANERRDALNMLG